MTRVRTTTVRSAIENYHMSAAQKELISASLRDARLALSIGRHEEFAEILSNPHNPREVGRHWAERSAMLIATASVEYRAIEDHAATKALDMKERKNHLSIPSRSRIERIESIIDHYTAISIDAARAAGRLEGLAERISEGKGVTDTSAASLKEMKREITEVLISIDSRKA